VTTIQDELHLRLLVILRTKPNAADEDSELQRLDSTERARRSSRKSAES
jgi:hypothetical protein